MKEGKSVWELLWVFVCAILLIAGITVRSVITDTVSYELTVPCAAETTSPKMLVPVGWTVGIKLFSKGVMVIALSEIQTANGGVWPAKQCGLQEEDIISEIGHQPVNSIEEAAAAVQKRGGSLLEIQAMRNGQSVELKAEAVPCVSDGSYKLGAWLRDSMAGIGHCHLF